MDLFQLCFEQQQGYVEVAKGGIEGAKRSWIPMDQLFLGPMDDSSIDYFFGPAPREQPNKMGKKNCMGAQVCWVDIDRPAAPVSVLPPSAKVWSGHGWHYYWRLESFVTKTSQVEGANRVLANLLGGDSTHNIDRFMRIPGSLNGKSEPHKLCKLIEMHPGRVYRVPDIMALEHLDSKIVRKIVTGDRRGYPSRSERDFVIIKALLGAGYERSIIEKIFQFHRCGDKYRDPDTRSSQYLTRTIQNARKSVGGSKGSGKRTIFEQDNCYYGRSSGGVHQLSTFTLTPKRLLEGAMDSLVCDVRAQSTDYVWEDVILPREAFAGLSALNKHLTKASWVWLGRDVDVRYLLAHLVEQLTAIGIPRAIAVHSLGRHQIAEDDRVFAVLNNCTLASDGSIWNNPQEAPVVYVPTGREAPMVSLTTSDQLESTLEALSVHLEKLNRPECFWPILGWFMATPMKPALEELHYRFPILNLSGTRGSGKTSLVLDIMQPLLGVSGAKGYDANTTHFVALSLLGATNAVPIAFAEFRVATSSDFLRFVLLAYDSGKDARGRPDQTTVTYPLTAPFTLDGEDRVDDSAALERVVAVTLSPQTIQESSEAWYSFQVLLHEVELTAFALPYWLFTLQLDIPSLLRNAEEQMFEAFELNLPSRIRRNLVVSWFGILAFGEFMQSHGLELFPAAGAAVLTESLANVYSTRLGRAVTAADSFIEFVVNAAAQQTRSFPWCLEGNLLWFQHTPAFEYFTSRRASQRQTTLTRDAMRLQLRELTSDYTMEPKVKTLKGRRVLAYGVDLIRAHQAGLDVPDQFRSNSFTIDY